MLTFCWGFVFCFSHVAFSSRQNCQNSAALANKSYQQESKLSFRMNDCFQNRAVSHQQFVFCFFGGFFSLSWSAFPRIFLLQKSMTEENWCDHVQVGVKARFRPVLCLCLYISECVCAVCRGRWPPAADSVGADVGEVLWASESLPVVSEIQCPPGSASLRGMGNAAESPTSSVSDNTHISLSWEANCASLRHKYWREPVCCSPLPFSHFTFCSWACWFTPL